MAEDNAERYRSMADLKVGIRIGRVCYRPSQSHSVLPVPTRLRREAHPPPEGRPVQDWPRPPQPTGPWSLPDRP